MGHIFVSYSRHDAHPVDELINALENAGYSVWIDRSNIQAGAQWRRQIVDAIDKSDVFVIVLSPNSTKSANVRKELDLAEEASVKIIPIVIQPTSIPSEMRYQLVGNQHLDFTSDFQSGLSRLISAIERIRSVRGVAFVNQIDFATNESGKSPKPFLIRVPELFPRYLWGGLIVISLFLTVSLVFLLNDNGSPLSNSTVTPEGSEPTSITATVTNTADGLDVNAWKHGKIAYVSKQSGHNRLYVLELTPTLQTDLVPEPSQATNNLGPQWSPDGNWLAFYSSINGEIQTMIVADKENSVPYRPTESTKADFTSSPTWSPDGDKILAYGTTGGETHFFVIGAFSNVETQVFSPRVDKARLPAWSPGGNIIAFAGVANQEWSIFRMPLTDSSPIELTSNSADDYAPAWSPNGSMIAYQSDFERDSGKTEIWIAEPSGENSTRITHSSLENWSRAPSWSPDGRWIAFVSDQAGSIGADYGELFVVSIEDRDVIQLTETGGQVYDWRPSWGTTSSP